MANRYIRVLCLWSPCQWRAAETEVATDYRHALISCTAARVPALLLQRENFSFKCMVAADRSYQLRHVDDSGVILHFLSSTKLRWQSTTCISYSVSFIVHPDVCLKYQREIQRFETSPSSPRHRSSTSSRPLLASRN